MGCNVKEWKNNSSGSTERFLQDLYNCTIIYCFVNKFLVVQNFKIANGIEGTVKAFSSPKIERVYGSVNTIVFFTQNSSCQAQ